MRRQKTMFQKKQNKTKNQDKTLEKELNKTGKLFTKEFKVIVIKMLICR